MTAPSRLPQRDLELLSAYLDGGLPAREAARLEVRLGERPELRAALDELRWVSQALRALPEVRPPRSFALRPAAVPQRRSWSFPALRFATVVASALFVLTTMVRGLTVLPMAMPAAAPEAARLADEAEPEAGLMMQAPAEPEAASLAEEATPLALEAAPEELAVEGTPPAAMAFEAPEMLSTKAAPEAAPPTGPEELTAPTDGLLPVEAEEGAPIGLIAAQWGFAALTGILLILTLRARRRT